MQGAITPLVAEPIEGASVPEVAARHGESESAAVRAQSDLARLGL